MIKFVLLAVILTLVSAGGGACLAGAMNRADGAGATEWANGWTPTAGSGQGAARPRGADQRSDPEENYTARLLQLLEREHEMRRTAEEDLARERARQQRRQLPTREVQPSRPSTYRTQPVAQPVRRHPTPPPTIVQTPPTAPVVPQRRPVQPAERQPARGEIAAGTTLQVVIDAGVSSNRSQNGDRVTATVRSTITDGDTILIRNGDRLTGTVTAVENSGRMRGSERLVVNFDAVVIEEVSYRLETGDVTRTGPGQRGQNTTRIGGGAAAGAVLGAILGGKRGAAMGGALGAAGGTAAAAAQRGAPAKLEAGETLSIRTTSGTTLPAQ